jgi:hypothetical protein
MALVKYGATVAQISGSVGGVVFARNRGGAYIRNKTAPVQPGTALQLAARTIFGSAVNTWTNILDSTQREAWNTYASAVPYTDIFGETRYYSGQQRYIQCFTALVNHGGTPSAAATAPTVYTEAENVISTNMVITQGAAVADSTFVLAAATTPQDVAADDVLMFHTGGPMTQAASYFNGPYRYTGKSTYVSGATYPAANLTDPYARVIASGNKLPVFWRILKADNRISSASRAILTVGAYVAP